MRLPDSGCVGSLPHRVTRHNEMSRKLSRDEIEFIFHAIHFHCGLIFNAVVPNVDENRSILF